MIGIPVIDLNADKSRQTVCIAKACKQSGFFQIVNHGIDPELKHQFIGEVRRFFHLPAAVKASVARTLDNPWGYYDREFTKNTRDHKEIFDLALDEKSQWPQDQDNFMKIMLHWFSVCEEISFSLLRLVCESLGLQSDRLDHYFREKHSSFLRLNYFPSGNARDDTHGHRHLGINRHTDAGALTILVQDDVPSLQVRHGQNWQTIQPVENSFLVNIGDLLQVWSNDQYKAPEHRVVVQRDTDRVSAPFFFNPSYDTLCEPLINEPPRYQPVNWSEFRTARAMGDYGDYGREAQITDYLLPEFVGSCHPANVEPVSVTPDE